MGKRTVVKTSIGVNYLRSGWGKAALLREVISNAKDAVEMHGGELAVNHEGTTLSVINTGATLSRRNMLLGGGDKFGRSDTIGQFEEGLKLALLVAAREEIPVRIHTGYEVWKPSISSSAAFGGEDVLAITVTETDTYFDGTKVEIGKISAKEWAIEKEKFLFLMDDEVVGRVQPSAYATTDVLMHPAQKGRIYVKGIFVQSMEDVAYGYDLRGAKVDRDRKMVDAWDAKYAMTEALASVGAKDAQVAKTLYQQAKLNREDGSGYTLGYAPKETVDALLEAFDAEFGPEAIACTSAEEVEKLRYLGRSAGVVPDRLREVIEKRRTTARVAISTALLKPLRVFQREELTSEERTTLDMAAEVLADAGFTFACDVVEFHDAGILGKIDSSGMIGLARKNLSSLRKTVAVLVHEIAHRESGASDGTVAHTRAIEDIWEVVWGKAFGV